MFIMDKKKLQVDVIGPFSGSTGWATHAQAFAREMNKLCPVSYRAGLSRRDILNRDFPMLYRGIKNSPRKFGVVVTGAPYPGQLSARWVVWETTTLPESVLEMCDTTDYLWVPSSWGYNNLVANGIDPNRISIVPEGVDAQFFKPARRKDNDRFRFLFVGKWETRKCVEQLVNAFSEEFSGNKKVELVLHAHNNYIPGFSQKSELEKIKAVNKTNIVLSGMKNKKELRRLYQSADCFVMPTRAEGWGLPILESMACGVPAIVTAYSAPMDFLNAKNSYLLNVERMIDAKCELFNINTGQWADPDIKHLKSLMREAFENPKDLHTKGLAARETALHFTWKNSAHIAYKTIMPIVSSR